MKKIFRIFSIFAVSAIFFSSCSEKPLVKADIDAKYEGNPANIPSVTIEEPILDARGQVATVVASFSTSGTVLEAGFEFCKTDDFNPDNSIFAIGEMTTAGISANVPLSPLTTYHIRAYVIVKEGVAYSSVKSCTTLDIPFIEKVCGTFTGTIVSSAYGDSYSSTLVIVPNTDDPTKVWIGNIEPYYASKEYVYPDFNYVEGALDEANSRIVVVNQSPYHLGSYIILGANAVDFDSATDFADVVFNVVDGGSKLYLINGFGTYGPNGWDDQYSGNVTFKKK